MGLMSNIICKTVGIAGMSAVVYDAYSMGKHHATAHSATMTADSFEHIIADSRTTSTESPLAGSMQKKVSELRMNNPLVSTTGKIKGFLSGFFSTLGDNIVPVGFASLALAAKGFWQKLGAWGVAGYGLFMIAKEGFGFGKDSAVD